MSIGVQIKKWGLAGMVVLSLVASYSLGQHSRAPTPPHQLTAFNAHDQSRKKKVVIKISKDSLHLLNEKGLLSGFLEYLNKHYALEVTSDLSADADVFLVYLFHRPFSSWTYYFRDSMRWLKGDYTQMVTPDMVCRDSSKVKLLYSTETWTSFPEGFDDCFDLMIGFDQRRNDPRYMTIPTLGYDFFGDKISTHYDDKKDPWRASGCAPEKRKYDICFLNSNGGKKAFMHGARSRRALFHNFSKRTFVASGGKVENNIGHTVPRGDELNWMMNCKFVIAYENQIYPGYVTEKPYQAWLAGAIPIYDAHRSVFGYINKEALIYAPDFDSNDEMIDYVMRLINNKKDYCSIWNQSLHIDESKNYTVQKEAVTARLIELFNGD